MAETLAFYGEQGFGMAVLPADTQADLHEIQFVLDLMQIRLTTEAELQGLFPDSEVGVMPPFVNLYGLPEVVDAYLAEADVIAFNAVTHKDVVHMRSTHHRALVRPAIHFFGRPFAPWKVPFRTTMAIAATEYLEERVWHRHVG